MRKITLLACASALTLLAACDPHYDNGYYDANGNYVSTPDSHVGTERNKATWPGKPVGYYNDSNNYHDYSDYAHPPRVYTPPPRHVRTTRVVTTDTDAAYLYELPGVYNLDGDYLGTTQAYGVPNSMVPPRGLCLVWFPHRMTYDQPQAQSCGGLIDRAPSGSYVVYGG